ncbi:MAG: type III pantothenate kinase [Clostridia bacterium]|nr:type III pantothenate kinase [Clostridia bacterium]
MKPISFPKGRERMVLTIDIGNTNITFGSFEGETLRFVARIATNASLTEDEYAAKLQQTLTLYGAAVSDIKGAIISSVVPPLNSVMKKAVFFLFGIEPIMVGPGIKTGISIHCDTPSSVGSDLICACVAAHYIYGSPSLIVDMGTATKMMVVNRKGAFVGVSIIPGVHMGMRALAQGTAQLPQVSLETPPAALGKNTVDSIRSGVIFGSAALVDGMIDRINEEAGEQLPVYATGGLAPIITAHCRHEMTLDPHLVLKGLNILYTKNN